MPFRTTGCSRWLWRSSDTTSSFGIPRSIHGLNLMIAESTVSSSRTGVQHARRPAKACVEGRPASENCEPHLSARQDVRPLTPLASLVGGVNGKPVAFGQPSRSATMRPRACRLQQWQRREGRKRKHFLCSHVSDANLRSKELESAPQADDIRRPPPREEEKH